MNATAVLASSRNTEQLGFNLTGELGPLVLPKSKFEPNDKTLLGTLNPDTLWEGCREIRRMKTAYVIVENGNLTLSHRLIGRSSAETGSYGKVPPQFMAQLAMACKRCRINYPSPQSRRKPRYAAAVQIRVEHQHKQLTITAGKTVFTVDVGEYLPL